jgi:hypothetical protein
MLNVGLKMHFFGLKTTKLHLQVKKQENKKMHIAAGDSATRMKS